MHPKGENFQSVDLPDEDSIKEPIEYHGEDTDNDVQDFMDLDEVEAENE